MTQEYRMTFGMGLNTGRFEHGEALLIYNRAYRKEHGLVMYYPRYNDPPIWETPEIDWIELDIMRDSIMKQRPWDLPKGAAMAQKYKVVTTESGLHEVVEKKEKGKTSPMNPRQLFTEKHAAHRYAKTFNENQEKKGEPHNTTEEE